MATMYDDVDAICPYYKRSEKQKIVCESTGNYALELSFDRKDDRKAHKKKYCDTFDYQKCAICQINERNFA